MDGARFRERGLSVAKAARYTILRRGTTAGSSAPLFNARSDRREVGAWFSGGVVRPDGSVPKRSAGSGTWKVLGIA